MADSPRFPGIRITTNGNQLVSYHTEARITDGGIFYPITPSTEMGEQYQLAYAQGNLNVFGRPKIAIECEGEHAAAGGAIAFSVTGKRAVNFTSGQGLVYGIEQAYHAPGKCSTMVLEVAARALTKHALNVHCGHDDIYAALDTGWTILFGKDAQQAADQALILRRVTELSLTPGINTQDGFLTSHLERTFYKHESQLMREFLGAPDDIIECPTEAQRRLFGPTRRRVPAMIDLRNPMLLGPVQNQEHYMNGVIARRDNFAEAIPGFLEQAYAEFAALTGRNYGFISEYRTDDAEVVFLSLGCAAENVEAAVDYLRSQEGAKVGSLHLNVLRPFPEAALVQALRGKRALILLERTDEALSGDNPLTRDVRAALGKACEGSLTSFGTKLPALGADEIPRIFSGSYGLGSRDFRPEGILGAYEFATGKSARKDGRRAEDGTSYFTLGIDHPYEVLSERTPSLLPEGSIAVRFHSIGGWGMITTGKNLSEVIGAFGNDLMNERGELDEFGRPQEMLHISANPKYGSEKKGAPTSYFLVVAPERVRVNCDLRHVDVVLCCDPRAFTQYSPIEGIREGGTFVWESEEEPEIAWQRIPPDQRREIQRKNIRVFLLPGFDIARKATDREDLQLRMQGNAFLGGFFRVSPFLSEYGISDERFQEVVRAQYERKFGRFGEAVVASNMTVMTEGFARVVELPIGDLDAPDRSSMRIAPMACATCDTDTTCHTQPERAPVAQVATFDAEFRAGLGYDQPASTLASVGVMAAATGATTSKYVARRETPLWIAENCTQCMECITACPDTALPNTAQPISAVLAAAMRFLAEDLPGRGLLEAELPAIEERARERMTTAVKAKESLPFKEIVIEQARAVAGVDPATLDKFVEVFERIPFAYSKTPQAFMAREKKQAGSGGIFAIMVSDLCKGCGECVVECGEKSALVMASETEDLNADHVSGTNFLDLLPDTPTDFLGRYDVDDPLGSHALTLKNHLMVRSFYEALVSGDGACAGCGEKSVLRAVASLTEALMRPLYHAKAERMEAAATELEAKGAELLATWSARDRAAADRYRRVVAHVVLGLGGEDEADSAARLEAEGMPSDTRLIDALVAFLRQDAFDHRDLRAVDGRLENGMAVMAMGAHTGCNTVYGSTPPSNPHPYPWMNSLFQDGATITWLFGESFVMDHARRSILPERLSGLLLDGGRDDLDERWSFELTHFTDALMTDAEIAELPKAWCIGGDGGMGDIGFQNVSKVVLQNRPNVKLLMLDTQVYSNTGGQNSDSTPMLGGGDMNQFGSASQGKYTEKKSLAEIFGAGHGSPYVAQVSLAGVGNFYKAILEGLAYRGTAFLQCFTTCQPEHGVADDVATLQASRVRDSRCMPEFVFDPQRGESYGEALSLKGNPSLKRDWAEVKSKAGRDKYNYTIAHWAATEARFRRHLKPAKPDAELTALDDMLARITQNDVVHRRFLDETHHAYVPDFGVYIETETDEGKVKRLALSRQMVLFCVERRRAWRMMQSRAGLTNEDYQAQKALLAKLAKGEVELGDFLNGTSTLLSQTKEELATA
jgi:pyruvate-ferredoxin/flavodoxin oxidoreductase